MTEKELIKRVVKSGKLDKKQATIAVSALWEVIEEALDEYDIVSIPNSSGKDLIATRS